MIAMIYAVNEATDALERARRFCTGLPGLRLAVLYGSAAQDRLRPDSDVDLAIAFDEPLAYEELAILGGELSLSMGRNAEVVDLLAVGGLFLHEILSGGRLAFNADADLYARLMIAAVDYMQDVQPIVRREQIRRIREFSYGA